MLDLGGSEERESCWGFGPEDYVDATVLAIDGPHSSRLKTERGETIAYELLKLVGTQAMNQVRIGGYLVRQMATDADKLDVHESAFWRRGRRVAGWAKCLALLTSSWKERE